VTWGKIRDPPPPLNRSARSRHKVAPDPRGLGENWQWFYKSQLYDDRANELRCCGVFKHQWCGAGEKEYIEPAWELIIWLMTRFLFLMSALLDTGCDTSIIGARLLPPGTHIEPTLQTLTAANGTPIPVEWIVKAQIKIGGHKQFVQALVTKAVHEVILGIDFLIDADVDWRFSQGRIRLGDKWVQLHERQKNCVHERKPPWTFL